MCFPSRWWCWSGIIITISLLHPFRRQFLSFRRENVAAGNTTSNPSGQLDHRTCARIANQKRAVTLYNGWQRAPSARPPQVRLVLRAGFSIKTRTRIGIGSRGRRNSRQERAWPSCASIRRVLLRSGFSLCVCVVLYRCVCHFLSFSLLAPRRDGRCCCSLR